MKAKVAPRYGGLAWPFFLGSGIFSLPSADVLIMTCLKIEEAYPCTWQMH
jgi:hypothetical protein